MLLQKKSATKIRLFPVTLDVISCVSFTNESLHRVCSGYFKNMAKFRKKLLKL